MNNSYRNYTYYIFTISSMNTETEEINEVVWYNQDTETTDETTAIVLSDTETANQNLDIIRDNSSEQEIVKSFSTTLDESGVTDEFQAQIIYEMMTKANKTITQKDSDPFDVPDWTARLWALKLSLQSKGHLTHNEVKKSDIEDKIFVFVK